MNYALLTIPSIAIQGRTNSFGNPSPSFGAGIARVPAPIFTKPQKSLASGAMYPQSRRESVTKENLPSLTQAIIGDRDSGYSSSLAGFPLSQHTNHAVQAPQDLGAGLNGFGDPTKVPQNYDDDETNDPIDANPYAHRADEIGPSHHIPGVGLLDDILAPSGWKEGDEPIDQHAARSLFNESRRQAREILEASLDETKNIPAEQQETRNAARDKQWEAQFKLDQLLLKERVSVYNTYQERKRSKLHQGDVKRAIPTRMLPTIHPQPINAMASVPARLQAMYPSSMASSPDLVGTGLPPTGIYGTNRGSQGMWN